MAVETSGQEKPVGKEWTYRGGQVKRGGGEFIGQDKFGLEDVLRSVGLAEDQMGSSPAPDALDEAFARLRELAQEKSAAGVVELLIAELRKGAAGQDGICASYARMIIAELPETAAAFKELIENPEVNTIPRPQLHDVITKASG